MFSKQGIITLIISFILVVVVFWGTAIAAADPGNICNIGGTWNVDANGYQGKLIIRQNGASFEGSILNDPIVNGVVYANKTISFTRPSSNQNYTGICYTDNDGKQVIKGIFTYGGRIYIWSATGVAPIANNGSGEREIFNNGNIYGVQNGPANPTRFTVNQPYVITYIYDYHYFNHGTPPGKIALRHDDGTLYGPWQTTGRPGQGNVPNAYWEAYLNEEIKPGNYTVVDSDPQTWSCNAQSGNCGFTIVKGYPAQGAEAVPGTPNLAGTWDLNANGYLGKLEITPTGSVFQGSIFGEPLTNGAIQPNGAVTFTRPSCNQNYQGTYAADGNGNLVLKGTFTWEGGTYNWTAVKKLPAPVPSSGTPVNAAQGKKAEQSSTEYGGLAQYAVDGNTDGGYFNNSCSHTGNNAQAWWQVDLDAAYPIQNIVVWNRTDSNSERLSRFYVLVSNTPFASPSLNTVISQPGVSNYYVEKVDKSVNVPINRTGRYVRIQLTGTNYLHMAEVQVFTSGQPSQSGANSKPDSNTTGITLDKKSYVPGEEIKVNFRAAAAWPGNAWIGIIPSTVPHGDEGVNDQNDITYQYLNGRGEGTMAFKAPGPGQWDMRMNDSDSGGKEVASVSFTVGNDSGGTGASSNGAAGNSSDNGRWYIPSDQDYLTSGTSSINGNTVTLAISGNNTAWYHAANEATLSGDFEVTANLALTKQSSQYGQNRRAMFYLMSDEPDGKDRQQVYIGMYQKTVGTAANNGGYSYGTDMLIGGGWGRYNSKPVAGDPVGLFKITRKNGEIGTYYYENNNWVKLSAWSEGFKDRVRVYFVIETLWDTSTPAEMSATFNYMAQSLAASGQPTLAGVAKEQYQQVDLEANGQLPGGGLRGGRSLQNSKVPIGGNLKDGGKFYLPWFSSNTRHNQKASFATNSFAANCIYILANCGWWYNGDTMAGKPLLKITVRGSQMREFYLVSGANIWEWNAGAPNLAGNSKKVSIVDQCDSNSYLTRFDFPTMNVTGVNLELVATTNANNNSFDNQQIVELHGITLGNESGANGAANGNRSANGELTLNKATFIPGEEIKVAFRASKDWPDNAWIGIIPSSIPHGDEGVNDQNDIAYQYISGRGEGTMVFKAPGPGQWDFRMNDTDNGGKEIASVSFTVR